MTLPHFVDRQISLGEEKRYRITERGDGTVDIEKLGIVEEGSRINAATLNSIVDHVNDTSIHILRSEYEAEIASLRNRIQLIEATFPDNFKNNLFTEDLATLKSVKLIRGRFNSAESRLEV